MNPQYAQMTLDFIAKDETDDTAFQHRAVMADDAAGDLRHVLTQITHFLRAAGFTYVGQLAVFNTGNWSDEPDTYGDQVDSDDAEIA